MSISTEALAGSILDYWFASLDDTTPLDREVEPFRTCFARWYGKQPAIDAEIRTRFEPALLSITRDGAHWDDTIADWQRAPLGLLALVILLDQLPRNMYRDTARMYAHDDLALAVTTLAIREYETHPLTLVQRMFIYVPLMHVENLTLQQAMVTPDSSASPSTTRAGIATSSRRSDASPIATRSSGAPRHRRNSSS